MKQEPQQFPIAMNIDANLTDAARWEAGCSSDEMRNTFLIPSIVGILEAERPASILDIGSATSYVPRKIQETLSYQPEWTLLDNDAIRLSYGIERAPSGMRITHRSVNLLDNEVELGKYEAVISTFTLLEMEDHEAAIDAISGCLETGTVIIALPDVWSDALNSSSPEAAARTLVRGNLTITKTDKFTGEPYPFHAVRIETIVASFLRRGFMLQVLRSNPPTNDVFLLVFQRLGRSK